MLKSFFLERKWRLWSWGGLLLLIVSLWFQVQMTVAINTWYGRFYDLLYVNGGVASNQKAGQIKMKGREVFRHAVKKLSDCIKYSLKKNKLKKDNIDWIIPHQANKRIMDMTAKKLGISKSKVLISVDQYANTSSASIPLTLDYALSKKIVKRGQIIVFEAIGGGLTWGCSILKY